MDFFNGSGWEGWEDLVAGAIRAAIIIVVVYIGLRLIGRLLEPAVRRAIEPQMAGQPQAEVDKRVNTLAHVIHRTAWVAAIPIVLITVLPEFGVNTSALLAGTSLFALAIGFGAQSLVKDVISGAFILVENQYAKGDVVNICGVGGVVEDVNLRRTLLRDLDGAMHSVPNGQVEVASNLTRTWSRANMTVSVSYSESLEHVFGVIDRTGEQLAADPDWSADVIEPPKVLGVESFGDSGIEIRVLGVTQPIRQWDVMRELRRRLKIAFDAEGIEIPYPHRTLVTTGQKAADGLVVRTANAMQPAT
jgi:small conductance mechanosensitive channel